MREIKFKIWNEELGEMYKLSKGNYLGFTGLADSYVGADKAIWLQYTGLKDHIDKEIYEGDIIDDKKGLKGKVFFNNGSFRVTSTHKGINDEEFFDVLDLDLVKDNKIYVIGNVYENPELLKEEEG